MTSTAMVARAVTEAMNSVHDEYSQRALSCINDTMGLARAEFQKHGCIPTAMAAHYCAAITAFATVVLDDKVSQIARQMADEIRGMRRMAA